jgi:hypothetical protein
LFLGDGVRHDKAADGDGLSLVLGSVCQQSSQGSPRDAAQQSCLQNSTRLFNNLIGFKIWKLSVLAAQIIS